MRALYNEWLDSGNQTFTASGNVRAPSRVDICNMVVKAWKDISEEMIAKSFLICGQVKNGKPEEITCMKENHPAHEALTQVKQFWDSTAQEFTEEDYVEEIDQNQDKCVVHSGFVALYF